MILHWIVVILCALCSPGQLFNHSGWIKFIILLYSFSPVLTNLPSLKNQPLSPVPTCTMMAQINLIHLRNLSYCPRSQLLVYQQWTPHPKVLMVSLFYAFNKTNFGWCFLIALNTLVCSVSKKTFFNMCII